MVAALHGMIVTYSKPVSCAMANLLLNWALKNLLRGEINLLRRNHVFGFLLIAMTLLAGCDMQGAGIVTQVVEPPTSPPTNTVVPIISMTPRFTATLIPTSTFIPSITVSPTNTAIPPTFAQPATLTPTPVVSGSIVPNSGSINMRAGPGTNFKVLQRVDAGTTLQIIAANETRDWYMVRLDDGTSGWIMESLLLISDVDRVPAYSELQLTQIAEAPTTEPSTPGVPGTPGAAPTLRARQPTRNDVLAYCDNPGFPSYKGKTFKPGTEITIYWNWFAATPEQIQDHIDYGQYEVTVDGKALENWSNYRTSVVRQDGKYNVYWYVPLGAPEVGEHTISYKLTWKQKIEDGEKSFGPGGDEETNTGSCVFTVK
jgi:hypothetical protein